MDVSDNKLEVFLSYSTQDHHFAELAGLKLAEAGISVWRDAENLQAGFEWRKGIELGISNSAVVVVALSSNSSESSYVTFEWAYGMGKGKPIIPLKLNDCQIHPRLATIQYLDFSRPMALPWDSLVERIQEIELDDEVSQLNASPSKINKDIKAIIEYLNQRGYTMASFDRIRKRVNENLDDDKLLKLIADNRNLFRKATLRGDRPGLAKIN